MPFEDDLLLKITKQCMGTSIAGFGGVFTYRTLPLHSLQSRPLFGPVFTIIVLTIAQEVFTGPKPPGVVLLELHPAAMEAHGFEGGAVALLQRLYSLGYTYISHSG